MEAVLVLAFATAAALVWLPWDATNDRRADEAAALEAVRRIAAAQATFRERRLLDVDGDGTAEYGTLADLERARLVTEPVRSDEEAPHVDVGGYRLEVLRPERLERDGRARWTRGEGRVDPALAPQKFAVTAIPRRGAERGLRSFYLDAAGRLYAAEGVQDADRDPSRSPPTRELLAAREEVGEGPVWRLAGASATSK
jgi:hypothetical protein